MKKIFMLGLIFCLLLTGCSSEYKYEHSLNGEIYKLSSNGDINKSHMSFIGLPSLQNSLNAKSEIYEVDIDDSVKYYICAYTTNSIKDILDGYSNFKYPDSNESYTPSYIYRYYGVDSYLLKYYTAWNNNDIKRKDTEISWVKVNNLRNAKDKEDMLLLYIGEVRTLTAKNLKTNEVKKVDLIFEYCGENAKNYIVDVNEFILGNPRRLLYNGSALFDGDFDGNPDKDFIFANEFFKYVKYSSSDIVKHLGVKYVDVKLKNIDGIKEFEKCDSRVSDDGTYLLKYRDVIDLIKNNK